MRIQIAAFAPELVQRRQEAFLHDTSMARSVRSCINVHLTKFWIPGFWTVALHAQKPGSESFLDVPIGVSEDGTPWFFPSQSWWIAHANVSHSESGLGCDADVHTKFLSREGAVHEFDYATVTRDNTIHVLGRADFQTERDFWHRAFGR
jgi:hypothetical protein